MLIIWLIWDFVSSKLENNLLKALLHQLITDWVKHKQNYNT